jgi:adenosylcobinamide kinase / adenosylcobinamide-phosphate guanylyltransferase
VASSLFVLGGARSGKSRFALAAVPHGARIAFVATARPSDAEMAARIARHQAERPSHWLTIEAPVALVDALDGVPPGMDGIIVDCLTVWVANLMARGDSDDAVAKAAEALAERVTRPASPITLVSNEVGQGVHPVTAAGLRFADMLGRVNQRIAGACDRVVLMVAGLPLTVKG